MGGNLCRLAVHVGVPKPRISPLHRNIHQRRPHHYRPSSLLSPAVPAAASSHAMDKFLEANDILRPRVHEYMRSKDVCVAHLTFPSLRWRKDLITWRGFPRLMLTSTAWAARWAEACVRWSPRRPPSLSVPIDCIVLNISLLMVPISTSPGTWKLRVRARTPASGEPQVKDHWFDPFHYGGKVAALACHPTAHVL